MRPLPETCALMVLSLLVACGTQIVEFPLETPTSALQITWSPTGAQSPTQTQVGTGTPTPSQSSPTASQTDPTASQSSPTATRTPTATQTATQSATPTADPAAPFVRSTSPTPLAEDVAITAVVTATFSQPMDGETINAASFSLQEGETSIFGEVSYDTASRTATFRPALPLLVGSTYMATVSDDAANPGGVRMQAPHTWSFSTSACGQAPIDLGSAANFAVLAGAGITNTGPTHIDGDIGVSPGTSITGFPPGTVVGAQHAGDPVAAQGIADLTLAYTQASLRVLCPVTIAGNIGGQTLTPGLYKSTSSLEISSGDLTLDAQGEPSAVFIFQVASTLTTTSGRQVILTGDAQAANIFWQVGSSATLGTTTVFKGTIMADQAITLASGATVDGRLLMRIAAATLDDNVVLKPGP